MSYQTIELFNPVQAHKAIAALRSRVKIAVTGTPLENSLTDLWALFSLTAPEKVTLK